MSVVKEKNFLLKIIIFNLIIFFTGCSSTYVVTSNISSFYDYQVLLADPLLLYDLYGLTNDLEKFDRNLYIGSIHFLGGFIRNPEKGMRIQAKKISFSAKKKFEDNIKNFFIRSLTKILKEKDINFLLLKDIPSKGFIKLIDEEYRGRHGDDGNDNISLPRIHYYAVDNDQKNFSMIKKKYNARYLMIPVIEHYYGHNGGWFNEQKSGCGAGVRISNHIYIYDLKSGNVVFSYQDKQKKIYDYKFRLSILQMGQELFELEQELYNNIDSAIP